ncbi:MAG TPA: nitrite reductase, partial [Microbacterium sp.]|nr:nitrite reductase [Microbacterium sp.]
QLVPVRPRPAPEAPTGDQLTLLTGRLLEHYQSGTQTRRVPELQDARPGLVAQIHPVTARDRGVTDGARVRVSNHRGSVTATVATSLDIRPGSVFLPFHYADGESANLLTNDAIDPLSKMPEFKTTVVSIERAAP